MKIKNSETGEVIFEAAVNSMKELVGLAVSRGISLRGAYLKGADLTGAILREADLTGAYLTGADLKVAYLKGAYLTGADLRGADLEGADLPNFQICPQEGGFYAWKKLNTGVVKIYIPEDAQRTSSLMGRKCRASHVKVISGPEGKSPTHKIKLTYRVGEIVYADSYNPDIRVECTNGIHFFMTKEEAEEWG